MIKKSKTLVVLSVLFLSCSFAHADSALIPGGYWDSLLQQGGLFGNLNNSLFGNSGFSDHLQPNCTYRDEYNPYTKLNTRNEVCNPHVLSSNYGSTYSAPAYNSATYYTPTVPTYAPTVGQTYYFAPAQQATTYYVTQPAPVTTYYFGGNSNSNSNNIYATNGNGYYPNSTGLYNTYYNGGRGDVSGFYDSPNLCYDGGSNCTGRYTGSDYGSDRSYSFDSDYDYNWDRSGKLNLYDDDVNNTTWSYDTNRSYQLDNYSQDYIDSRVNGILNY